jgi:hypothetical protein
MVALKDRLRKRIFNGQSISQEDLQGRKDRFLEEVRPPRLGFAAQKSSVRMFPLARCRWKRCVIAVPKTKDTTLNSNRCGTGLSRSANAASTSTLPQWTTSWRESHW